MKEKITAMARRFWKWIWTREPDKFRSDETVW